jgi:tetratricopeptide (TPR) repeat protein/DNA-binding CsgD family transcriptional regulator
MDSNKISYLTSGYFGQLEIINNILFTAREIDVVACITNMRGNSKIASILDIAKRTVEAHIINIKRKIDNSTREGIIDFVEKSGKCSVFRKHYQNLLIQSNFNKKLKSISTLVHNMAPTCYFVCPNEKGKGSIIPAIQNHLKLAGINIIIGAKAEETIGSKKEHFIYVISDQIYQQSTILEALQKAVTMPSHYTFLSVENIKPDVAQLLVNTQYINFMEQDNYYLTIFKVLKRIVPAINFDKTILQLQAYHQSVIDLQAIPMPDPSPDLKKNDFSIPTGWISKKKMRGTIISVIVVLLVCYVAIFGGKFMKPKQPDQNKETNQLPSSASNLQPTLVSYMPEILTGYENFIGRKKELQQIDQVLDKNNIVIITGCAGIGKSSLAIEYGKLYKKRKIVRYLHAASKTKIDQQYREFAQELNISTGSQPSSFVIQLVHNKLSGLKNKLLFIFDNVDQYDDVKEYLVNLPENIQAIVTTRQPMLITNKTHIPLEEFSNAEAEQYLKSSLQNKLSNGEFIHNLIEITGALPYNIKCIAAYILDNPSTINQSTIQEMVNKINDMLFQEFAVNIDPIRQHAWKILQYAANLDPDFINIEIINGLFPQNIELSSTALKKLESLSLISIINDQNDQTGFRIHRKLQKNVQNSAKNHSSYSIGQKMVTDNLLRTLDQLFPEINGGKNVQWQIASHLQPHVEKLLNTKNTVVTKKNKINYANLCYKLSKYHLRVNIDYHLALKYAKVALEQRHALYNKKANHPELADTFNIIGIIYRRLGNIQEGLKYSIKGLTMRQQLYSGDHPDIGDSLKHLGVAYLQNGETQQGLKYAQMALDMSRRLYSSNHYEIARALNTVGMCYLDLGNFKKSLEYLKESLNIFTTLNPVNYERVAALQSNISYNYNKLSDHTRALKYAKSSVDIFEKFYPSGHPRAIYSLSALGYALIIVNDTQQGLEILHKASHMSKKFSMDKHYITGHVLHDLGFGYFKNGNYKTALEYATKALGLRKELYANAKNHPELAESLHNLGSIHVALKNKNEGLSFYKEAIEMYVMLSLEHLPEANEIKQKIKILEST